MNKLFKVILGMVVKKKSRNLPGNLLSKQAREQIKILKEKGIHLPIMTF